MAGESLRLRGGKDASVIDLSPVCVSTQLGNSIYRNDTPPSLSIDPMLLQDFHCEWL